MLDRVVDAVFDRVLLAVVAGHLVVDLVRVVPALALLLPLFFLLACSVLQPTCAESFAPPSFGWIRFSLLNVCGKNRLA